MKKISNSAHGQDENLARTNAFFHSWMGRLDGVDRWVDRHSRLGKWVMATFLVAMCLVAVHLTATYPPF